jgi:hypothetical protein
MSRRFGRYHFDRLAPAAGPVLEFGAPTQGQDDGKK